MSHDANHEANVQAHEPLGYSTYFITWFSLVGLTALTVTAAGLNLGGVSVVVALAIAAVKASIVLFVFMHLKYEDALFHRLLVVMLVTLTIFIGLTFTDVLFR